MQCIVSYIITYLNFREVPLIVNELEMIRHDDDALLLHQDDIRLLYIMIRHFSMSLCSICCCYNMEKDDTFHKQERKNFDLK